MFWTLLLGVALASPPSYRAVDPLPWRWWGLQVGTYGGVDVWTGGGGPGAELRATLQGTRPVRGWSLTAGWSGLLEALPGTAIPWSDVQRGELRLERQGRVRPGVAARATAGFLGRPAWGEGLIAATLGGDMGLSCGGIGALGGALRGETSASGFGGEAALTVYCSPTPRVLVLGRTSAQAWAGGALPVGVFEARLSGQVQAHRLLTVDTSASVRGTTPGPLEAVAALPPGGSLIPGYHLGMTVRLARPVALRLELSGEHGRAAVRYDRFHGILGLVFQAGPATAMEPPPRPGGTPFRVRAPAGTASVAIAGTFTGWQPVPLEHRAGRTWQIQLDVPPGEHEYVYLVDGEPWLPASAVRRQDDFGGENAVLSVPASPR